MKIGDQEKSDINSLELHQEINKLHAGQAALKWMVGVVIIILTLGFVLKS